MTLESAIAGSWYPGTEREIRALAGKWEGQSGKGEGSPNVLLLPHAGWAYSGEIAWRAVRLAGRGFRRAVILAPSHRAWIENRLVAPEAEAVSTPLGKISVDREWIDRLALVAPVARNDGIHAAEHSAQIEYPLLQLALDEGFTVVPLVMGSFGHDQMAMCARALARLVDDKTLLVVSSDFTHYGSDFSYVPYGTSGGEAVREKVSSADAEAFSFIARGDADGFAAFVRKTGATICGHVPIELALRAMEEAAPRAVRNSGHAGERGGLARIAYATSSDADRDFTRFVCYTAAAGRVEWPGEKGSVLKAADRAYLLRVARTAIERAVRSGGSRYSAATMPGADAHERVPPAVLTKMGAFVTLNDRATGALRGCIGEILPMRPLVEAVAARAVDSARSDPRFTPVSERELAGIRVEVSALTPPKPVSSWRDIVLGRDGMTLEKGNAFAVFLPQVAPEQGWDLETTLSYLSQKAGLSADAWREGARFETFQAEVFHE